MCRAALLVLGSTLVALSVRDGVVAHRVRHTERVTEQTSICIWARACMLNAYCIPLAGCLHPQQCRPLHPAAEQLEAHTDCTPIAHS